MGTRLLLLGAAAILSVGLAANQAQGVTFGDNVAEPSEQAPWVVSIWVSPTGDAGQVSYGCTGTLIAPDVVLTAAHCVFENGSYFVKYGATTLEEEVELIPASNTWAHPRYNPTKFANDIGLIKLSEPVALDEFPSLGNKSISKAVNARSKFTLFGWGRNQNDRSPELLGTTRLLNLDRMAVKEYGSAFNANIMLGAGLYIAREKVWAGACSGDSGGPLLMRTSGVDYIVGVTSWGARDCDTSKPSVFARVTYYEGDIQKGIRDLKSINRVASRVVPTISKKPNITGSASPGSSLQCNTGTWKNALDVTLSWSSPSRLLNSTNESVTILNSDVGETFACDIIASGKNGSIRRTVSVKLPSEPKVVGALAISGISSEKPFVGGEELSCDGFTWGGTFDSTLQEWHVVKDPKSPALSESTLVGKNGGLKVTNEFLEKYEGSYLLCAVSANNKGFVVKKTITRPLEKGVAPEVKNLQISIEKNLAGAQALCAFDGAKAGSTVTYKWSYGSGEEIPGATTSTLRISEEIADRSQTLDLDCHVSLSNAIGVAKKSVRANKEEIAKLFMPVYQVRSSDNWSIGSQVLCEKTFGLSQGNSEIMWGVMASPSSTSFTRPLGMGPILLFNENVAHQASGEVIGCSILVNEKGALNRKYFSTSVPASAAPELATLLAPTVATQDPSNKTVKVTLQIPGVSYMNRSVMQLRLLLPGTDCDNRVIDSTPNQVLCTNLAGGTNYSASLRLSYLNPQVTKISTSPVTTFKTDALIPLTEAPDRVSAEQKEGGAIAYVGDQVDCPTDKGVKKLIESDLSRTSYTICWPADALAAWETGGRTWTNFLVRKKFNAPVPPQPIVVEQIMEADFSGGISVKFSIPNFSGFDAARMSMSLRVYYNTSGTWIGVTPGSTVVVKNLGTELNYLVNVYISCLSSCPPSSTSLEVWSQDLIVKTIKNTWVPTDVDPPVVTAFTPYSAADYKAVMPAAGPAGTTVGVRYNISDDVLVDAAVIRFVKSDGTVVFQQNNSQISATRVAATQIQKVQIPAGTANLGDVLTIQVRATDASGKSSAWVPVGTFTMAADIPDYPTVEATDSATGVTPLAASGVGGEGRIGSSISAAFKVSASRGTDGVPSIKLVSGTTEIPVAVTQLNHVGYESGGTKHIQSARFTVPAGAVIGTTYSIRAQITDYYDYKSAWTEVGTLTILPPYTP